MNKKGVSPLIATVLIIGFTIVLAAVVMQWGGSFVRTLTEQTAETTETATACIGLRFEIIEAKYDSTNTKIKFKVTNNVDKKIKSFIALLEDGATGNTESLSADGSTNYEPIGTVCEVAGFSTVGCDIDTGGKIVTTTIADQDKIKLIPMVEGSDLSAKPCTIDAAVSYAISALI